MKKTATGDSITLHRQYDLSELIQSRYDESSGLFNLPVSGEIKQITIFNPRAGASITLQKGQKLIDSTLMSFKGKTLYVWDHFPVPAQAAYEGCRKTESRYRGITVEFS